VDDHGAGSECSVLIHCSHNSHSLSNYPVDVALEAVDHGHQSLGYESSTVLLCLQIVTACAIVLQESGAEFAPLALSWSFLHILQESLLLTNLLAIAE